MTSTLPVEQHHPDLDITPPCEWYQLVNGMLTAVDCPHPAEWVIRSRCHDCGRLDMQIVCDTHMGQVTAAATRAFCPGCLRFSNISSVSQALR